MNEPLKKEVYKLKDKKKYINRPFVNLLCLTKTRRFPYIHKFQRLNLKGIEIIDIL